MTNFNTYPSQRASTNHNSDPFSFADTGYDAVQPSPFAFTPDYSASMPASTQYGWNVPPQPTPVFEQSNPWAFGDTSSASAPTQNWWEAPAPSVPAAPGLEQPSNPWQFSGNESSFNFGLGETQPLVAETPRHEALRHMKDKLVGFGRAAVESLVKLVPRGSKLDKAAAVYNAVGGVEGAAQTYGQLRSDLAGLRENPMAYRDQALETAKGAALEIGKTGGQAALEYVMKYYGLDRRLDQATGKDKVYIKKKVLFGRRVLTTLTNPAVTLPKVGIGAAKAGAKASKQAAIQHATGAARAAASHYGIAA